MNYRCTRCGANAERPLDADARCAGGGGHVWTGNHLPTEAAPTQDELRHTYPYPLKRRDKPVLAEPRWTPTHWLPIRLCVRGEKYHEFDTADAGPSGIRFALTEESACSCGLLNAKPVLAETLDADKVVPRSDYEQVVKESDTWKARCIQAEQRATTLADGQGSLENRLLTIRHEKESLELWARRKGWKP